MSCFSVCPSQFLSLISCPLDEWSRHALFFDNVMKVKAQHLHHVQRRKHQTSRFQALVWRDAGAWCICEQKCGKAKRYLLNPDPEESLDTMKLKVWLGNVKKTDRQGHSLQMSWHECGYVRAWVEPQYGMVSSGLEEECIWDPDWIRRSTRF